MPGLGRPLAVALALAAALGPAAALAAQAGNDPPRRGHASDDPRIKEGAEQAREAGERRRAQRPSAQERQRSRRAYKRRSRRQALELARDRHPTVTEQPAWKPLRLSSGERVRQFVGDFGARIDDGQGADRLVETTAPLRSTVGSGEPELVDLELGGDGAAFEPENPLVKTRIAGGSEPGVRFARRGIAFKLEGADAPEAPTAVNDKVFYADALEDLDALVTPSPRGAQISFQIRSEDAPEQARLAFDLPPGTRLREADETPPPTKGEGPPPTAALPGSVEIVKGERAIGQIAPPVAWDAAGERFEVSYEVQGANVVVRFPHRDRDLLYPGVVDPTVDNYQLDANGARVGGGFLWGDGIASWTWGHGGGATQASIPAYQQPDGSIGFWTGAGGNYSNGQFGQFLWIAPRRSFIRYVHFGYVDHALNGYYPGSCVLEGVYRFGDWRWESGSWGHATQYGGATGPSPWFGGNTADNRNSCWFLNNNYKAHAFPDAWREPAPPPGQSERPATSPAVVYRLQMNGTGARPYQGSTEMYGAAIHLDDNESPLLSANGSSAGERWLAEGANVTHSATARDVPSPSTPADGGGLGMALLQVLAPKSGGGEAALVSQWADCRDPRGTPRPSWCREAQSQSTTYNVDDLEPATPGSQPMPEGANTVTTRAFDALFKQGTATTQVKVDRSAPTLALSGSLKERENQELSPGTYQLSVNASDGNPSGPDAGKRSGMRSVQVLIDGDEVEAKTQECPAGSCPLSLPVELNTDDYSAGQHRVEVIATDQLDHEQREQLSFSIPCCYEPTSSWGNTLGLTSVSIGDVSGDGLEDLVGRNLVTGAISVARSNGEAFEATTPWSMRSELGVNAELRLADVDGDGLDDVVTRASNSPEVFVSASNGASFDPPVRWGTLDPSYALHVADLTGDDLADLIGRQDGTGSVVVGPAGSALDSDELEFAPAEPWSSQGLTGPVLFGDPTGDGAIDGVSSPAGGGPLGVGVSDSAGFAPFADWGSVPGNRDVVLADYNMDAKDDVVSRDRSSGEVFGHEATTSSFRASTRVGSFTAAYTLDSGDVDGDGRSDLVGRHPLTGDMLVSTANGSQPEGDPAEDVVDDPEVDYPEDCELLDQCGADASAANSRAAGDPPEQPGCGVGSLKLGFQDDARLHLRQSLRVPGESPGSGAFDGGAGEADANQRVDTILDRFSQAGGCVVRFIVYWGATENNDNTYYWTKLDKAVDRARAKGLQVLLTLTGNAEYECLISGERDSAGDPDLLYNPKARACSDDRPPPGQPNHIPCGAGTSTARDPRNPVGRGTQFQVTGIEPVPACYAEFVRATVQHFGRRVMMYSLWNEPNFREWLAGTRREESVRVRKVPSDRYRDLYRAGYVAAKQAAAAGGFTAKVMIGELGSRARGAARLGTTSGPAARVSAYQFLEAVVAPGKLEADGVAWHPYQHIARPTAVSSTDSAGIGDIARTQRTINALQKTNKLRKPGSSKRPDLLYTEFGYLNRGALGRIRPPGQTPSGKPKPVSRDVKKQNLAAIRTERERRGRFPLALSRARRPGRIGRRGSVVTGAKMMVLYTATEYEPGATPDSAPDPKVPGAFPIYSDDYGLFDKRGIVGGTRPYGKKNRRPRRENFGNAQPRIAYCRGIYAWARDRGYPVNRVSLIRGGTRVIDSNMPPPCP